MRIAIVNDTLMSVVVLRRIIESDKQHNVAWIAENGEEAVKLCEQDTPDLILMDIIMPVMDGVEATRQIMQQSPCAILLVTSTITGNTSKVFDAMGAGALDVINTPVIDETNESNMGEDLLKKINTIRKLITFETKEQPPEKNLIKNEIINETTTLIAIGSSTGGPSALVEVLNEIPVNFPAAFVVVQHIDKQFIESLIKWLDEQISLPVRMAKNGDKIEVGTVLVADSEQHLTLTKKQTLVYTPEPKDYPYKPSVNVFFDSIAHNRLENSIGVLLTGMGKDGANGLLSMQEKGFTTIAQEESSCAVYGMPKAAVELNAADLVLPPVEINAKIVQSLVDKDISSIINKNMEI